MIAPHDSEPLEWWIQAYLTGDRAAADWLARRACRLALRTATAIVGTREQADDIAQDVAVDVLRSLTRLREPRAFDVWVHRISVRHATRALGRRRRRERTEVELETLDHCQVSSAPNMDPDWGLTARGLLSAALRRLPVRQRLALAFRYVHDLSDEEIGLVLQCEQGTVRALLSRARAALREDTNLAELTEVSQGGPP